MALHRGSAVDFQIHGRCRDALLRHLGVGHRGWETSPACVTRGGVVQVPPVLRQHLARRHETCRASRYEDEYGEYRGDSKELFHLVLHRTEDH